MTLGTDRDADTDAVTRLLLLEEEERGGLAGALHDRPVQDLVATRYLADLAVAALRRGPPSAQLADITEARLAAVRDAAQDALLSTRRMLVSLTSRCMDGTGLPAALAALAKASEETGLLVEVEADDARVGALPPAVAVLAHRFVGALLADAAGRGATAARVCAELAPGGVCVAVSLPCAPDLAGPALRAWTERIALLGGRVETGPGDVTAWLPVPARPAPASPRTRPAETPQRLTPMPMATRPQPAVAQPAWAPVPPLADPFQAPEEP